MNIDTEFGKYDVSCCIIYIPKENRIIWNIPFYTVLRMGIKTENFGFFSLKNKII